MLKRNFACYSWKNILIFGASGHSMMIIDIILKKGNYNIKGYIDSFKSKGTSIYGYNVIGDLESLPKIIKEHSIHAMVIGVGDNSARQAIYNSVVATAPNLLKYSGEIYLQLDFPRALTP